MNLGIDDSIIFEGYSTCGSPLVPSPTISPANIISITENPGDNAPSGTLTNCKYIFREDSYDPVTRIRRGRFYNSIGSQNWHITPHPSYRYYEEVFTSLPVKHLTTFTRMSIWSQFVRQGEVRPLVILGSKDRFTLWRVLSIETNINSEEIIVLKGRQSFGALPDITIDKIPIERRDKVLDCLQKLQEDIFRASPASVVDRARDAASSILRAQLGDDLNLKVDADLDPLVKKFRSLNIFQNVSNAGDIVRILHSRAKPSVQEKLPSIRQIHEQDAELAVQCIGSILCDLGWAEWR